MAAPAQSAAAGVLRLRRRCHFPLTPTVKIDPLHKRLIRDLHLRGTVPQP